MKKILLVLLCLGAAYYFRPDWFGASSRGSVEVGEVVVFTHNNCGSYCDKAIELLRKRDIDYTVYNIEQDKSAEEKWRKMGGGNNFPVTFIGRKQLQGFYPQQYENALVEAFGSRAISAAHRSVIESNRASYGDNTVIMYATDWCPYCKKARSFFSENNIHYVELDVEKSNDAKADYDTFGAGGYPLIFVGFNRFDGFGPETKQGIKRLQ